jgi:sulfopyruvate decarboxylase subunit beta
MQYPEEELIGILKKSGIDFTSSLPCEKIKYLLEMVGREFFHVPLTREEEGVGISAGAALSGKRAVMFVQSSGIGNMINALLSLTGFYKLPLAIFVSQRGVYKEKIEAQVPMGKLLPLILRGAGIAYSTISSRDDFRTIGKSLRDVYSKNRIHVFLLSPAIWSGVYDEESSGLIQSPVTWSAPGMVTRQSLPELTRFQVLETIAPYLKEKVAVCNLGFPSKELFYIKHQPSNFYMLGSMGMATPIGLGISLSTDKEVVVIDGDGSLLMNPGVLATAAHFSPQNLTIIAIDNGAYGSTGSQPTLTASCVDLSLVAKGFGIRNVFKCASRKELANVLRSKRKELRFLHALAVPGNRDVPNIPLHHLVIKQQVQEVLGVKQSLSRMQKS